MGESDSIWRLCNIFRLPTVAIDGIISPESSTITTVSRRISVGADTARPVWFALRQANANGLVSVLVDEPVSDTTNFGINITVHTTPPGSHRPTSNSEYVIDGAITAFHDDPCSDALAAAMVPRLPAVSRSEFLSATRYPAGPLFPWPAVRVSGSGTLQISPAAERCWLGQYTATRDSNSRWPEVSGELFTIRTVARSAQALSGAEVAVNPEVATF